MRTSDARHEERQTHEELDRVERQVARLFIPANTPTATRQPSMPPQHTAIEVPACSAYGLRAPGAP